MIHCSQEKMLWIIFLVLVHDGGILIWSVGSNEINYVLQQQTSSTTVVGVCTRAITNNYEIIIYLLIILKGCFIQYRFLRETSVADRKNMQTLSQDLLSSSHHYLKQNSCISTMLREEKHLLKLFFFTLGNIMQRLEALKSVGAVP